MATRSAKPFTIADFKVPACYLSMIIGRDSAAALLARSGISISSTGSDEQFLPTIAFVDLCLEHIRMARSESLAYSPSKIPFGSFGLLVSAVAQGQVFDDALRRCAEAMRILRPDMLMKVGRCRKSMRFSVVAGGTAGEDAEVGLEFFVLALHSAFRWLTGERLRPVKVYVHARRGGPELSMLSVLCCPMLRRGMGVTLHYALEDAARPIRSLKYENWAAHELPEFLRLLQEAADEFNLTCSSVTTPIINRVFQLIEKGHHGEHAIAAQIGMSSTALRRHLADSGTSCRAILANVHKGLVGSLLRTDKSLNAIATEVGLSDARSLSRACLRWFGVTAAEYRRRYGSRDES